MDAFKSKYPAMTAFFALLAAGVIDFAQPNETLVQKLEASIGLVPQILGFIPQAGNLGSEASAIKASPEDIIGGIELLVTDFAFTSDKAKAIIEAAFPYAEKLASLVPDTKALLAAFKA